VFGVRVAFKICLVSYILTVFIHLDCGAGSDKTFEDIEFEYKENKVLERIYKGQKIRQSYIDYIVRKK
jgi:hypothetical protein